MIYLTILQRAELVYCDYLFTIAAFMVSPIVVIRNEDPLFSDSNCKKATHPCKLSPNAESRKCFPICHKKPQARITAVNRMLMDP